MEESIAHLANQKDCTGCLVCVDACSHKAINSYIAKDGHYYVKTSIECVGCKVCESVCPIVSKQIYEESECATFYAAWNKNENDRAKSASGGAFSAIARYILEHGGVVIGATIENVCDVRHIAIDDASDIYKLQGSKYTQSDTNGIYKETYRLLKEKKTVLFSGVGCQIGALLSYLKNKRYEGTLITIDLICGGVPSKLLLDKFVENEPYSINKILSFRTKENGWKPNGFVYNLKVEDTEGAIHDYTDIKNLVTTGFSTEFTERYSCYDCKFVGKNRLSDFTLGDLWGDYEHPKEHFNGLSLVIAHNQKAEMLLQSMHDHIQIEPCDETHAAKTNFRLVDGHNVKKYAFERRFLEKIFSKASYKTLKKIYANDYKLFSPWIALKIFRKIYFTILKLIRL